MAIYTRFGTAIEITAARIVPVWIVRTPDEIKWFYRTPKTKVGWKVEEQPIWHYQGREISDGRLICDGKWIDANSLKADGGWREIQDKLDEVNGHMDSVLYHQWNKAGAPEASNFWEPIEPRLVA